MMLPWNEMLRSALAAGVSPEAFWRLSLREWRWMTAGPPALARTALNQLMREFPDRQATGTHTDE
ncbi:phage tail assembly chaperone [Hyphomonas sp.]|uniref:phage tail assembly chaperone n=1 Tax=Hyphomonas sp. TaxID=87 RepID=UPI0039190A71